MHNPFPGMNPYLEHPALWSQVHNRLIVAIADALTAQIAPKYRASIEERVYTSVDDGLLVGITDVAVLQRNAPGNGARRSTQTLSQPISVRVPLPETITERFLEIRSTQTQRVISVIEILSPKNKRSKEGRAAYERKRQRILGSVTNLVELDLLRSGDAMPMSETPAHDYHILISRSWHRPNADLYCFSLADVIPSIPIPLQEGESEPWLDLQQLLNQLYERARFDLAIDYSKPVKPALLPEAADWVATVLKQINNISS